MLDVVIRNGIVYDGSGMPGYRADVGVRRGHIARVGRVAERARLELDARGLAVAPGFVDPHTHFDAQLCWDGAAAPSLEHGVTAVVPGNCSLSLAPVRAAERERLARMFLQIEEMPRSAFEAGVRWCWESFEEHLAALRPRLGINVAPLVGHSPIRMWVMGEAAQQRAASAAEIAQMQRLLGACLDAGAVGLSTSFVDVDEQFRPVPSRFAAPEELRALCAVLGDRGRVLQAVPEFWDATLCEQRIDALAELSLEFGIATTFSPLLHSRGAPEVAERILERVVQQSARGARVVPQVQTRPVDISFDLSERSMIFAGLPGWFELLSLPREAILARLREPDARRRLAAEARSRPLLMSMPLEFADVVVREVALDRNRALQGRSLGDIAAQRGCDPVEAMIDLSVEESLRTRLVCRNIGHDDPEAVGALLAHPLVQIGAGDGGAHQSRFSTYGDTSYLFAKYVRERPALSLEQAVRRLTGEICHTWGLGDRGLLHPGYAADVVVFDPDRIDRGEEVAVRDLPGGGARYLHRGVGVESVLVNGQLAWSASGGYTGACAGMIVTGGAPRG